ncbi:MAG: hypothetical protein M5U28_52855 [Sandaracinaceae bacterium]|nr:hypothetical protein [Sandaracinaceae bacterium]
MGAQVVRGTRGRARLRRLITLHQVVLARDETTPEDIECLDQLLKESRQGDNLLAIVLRNAALTVRQFVRGHRLDPDEPLLRFVRSHFDALAATCVPESLRRAFSLDEWWMHVLLATASYATAATIVDALVRAELQLLAVRLIFGARKSSPPRFSRLASERAIGRWLERVRTEATRAPDALIDLDAARADLLVWCHAEGLLDDRTAWSGWLHDELEARRPWLAEQGVHSVIEATLTSSDAKALSEQPILALADTAKMVGRALRPAVAANVEAIVERLERHWLATAPSKRFPDQGFASSLESVLLRLDVGPLDRQLCPLMMLDTAVLASEAHRDDEVRRIRASWEGEEVLAATVEMMVHHIAAWQPAPRYAPRPRTADGAELFLLDAAAKTPVAWALLLPGSLTHDGLEDLVTLVTVRACAAAPELRQTVERCVSKAPLRSSLRARAILDLLDGSERPSATLRPDLASRIAADVDRDGLFPRPLAVVSSTWLADLELEDWLRKHVSDGARAFFVDQGQQFGKQEEALVENLIKTLRDELATRPAPWRPEPGARPSLSLHARTHSKKEEKKSNLDVALLVTVEIEDRFEIKSAVAIQAKKPALEGTPDRWDLDVPQLKELMDHFPCAVYLLLCSSGPPLVVPSKHLRGLVRGTRREDQQSARVAYADIRSAAIPLAADRRSRSRPLDRAVRRERAAHREWNPQGPPTGGHGHRRPEMAPAIRRPPIGCSLRHMAVAPSSQGHQ